VGEARRVPTGERAEDNGEECVCAGAIASLAKTGQLDSQQAILLDSLRRFRNAVVHEPKTVEAGALEEWLSTTRQLWRGLRKEAT